MNESTKTTTPLKNASNAIDRCQDEYSPGTMLRKIIIYRKPLAVEEKYISLIRTVSPKKRKAYHKTSNVPLKDFNRFLKGIAGQFRGHLSTLKDSKLKKLTLPVMNPAGFGLPEIADESATKVVVVTSGQWNGVVFCSDVAEKPDTLKKFNKSRNGDIVGTATLENGEELSLLNMESILKREGFLSMI